MAGSKWWNSLSPKAKKAYIQEHPNSVYAKGAAGAAKGGGFAKGFKRGLQGTALGLAGAHVGMAYLMSGAGKAAQNLKDDGLDWI